MTVQQEAIVDQHRLASGFFFSRMTPRERDLAKFVADGYSDKEIAGKLGLALYTVKQRLGSLYKKLRVDGRHDLAVACITANLLRDPELWLEQHRRAFTERFLHLASEEWS